MKRILFLTACLFSLCATAFPQDNTLLKNDIKVYTKAIDAVMNSEDYKDFEYAKGNVKIWAKEVFEVYCENSKTDISADDYDDAKKKADAYDALLQKKDELSSQLDNADANLKKLTDSIAKLNKENHELKLQNERNESAINNSMDKEAELDRLNADVRSLNEQLSNKEKEKAKALSEKNALENSLELLKTEKAKLESDLASANAVILQKEQEMASLRKINEQYGKAFKGVEDAVNNVYYANKDKRFTEMDASNMSQAQNAYDGMSTVLKTVNTALDEDLRNKVTSINGWSKLSLDLKNAVAYMRGKYDANRRTRLMKDIETDRKNLQFSPIQQQELDDIYNALKNQEFLSKQYSNVISYLTNQNCLPTPESIKNAMVYIGNVEELANSFVSKYHVSYTKGMQDIKEKLSHGVTNEISDDRSFSKLINSFKEIF